ncbi:HNH endonuclease [Kutzneria albida]|nr:HNH endonuclease [Kutzneria albida]
MATIRTLRWDEPLPEATPRRYRDGRGYIRLRWLVGTQQYVEEYEHRLVAGRPHPRFHVHHRNEVKDDNRPENLEILTPGEHEARHGNLKKSPGRTPGVRRFAPYQGRAAMEKAQRRLAREAQRRDEVNRMRDLYESGLTTVEIAGIVGIDASNVYRRLAAAGVVMRTSTDYATVLNDREIGDKYQTGRSLQSLAREWRVTSGRIAEALDRAGVPRRKPGRSSNRAHEGENRAREIVYARSGRVCERCSNARATEWHHRKNRSQGGKWCANNGLDLCAPCHLDVTNTNGKRAEYEDKGWIVPSHRDPAAVPALIYHPSIGHDYVLLMEDGSVQLAPWPNSSIGHPDDLPTRQPDTTAGAA